MAKHTKKLAVGLAALLALAFGGTALARSSHSHAVTANQTVSGSESPGSENPSGPDTDNIQSGDQSTPDTAGSTSTDTTGAGTTDTTGSGEQPGTEQPASSEQPGTESGSEVPGNDGPGGHADEPGNANADHQFQGQE